MSLQEQHLLLSPAIACDIAFMHPIKVGLRKHTAMHLAGFGKSDTHQEMKVDLSLKVLRPLM
eukprot:1327032-Amphidinium_carterae.1